MCVDATLVSALTGDDRPHYADAGRAVLEAEETGARTYPELAEGIHAKLLVVGHGVGGRWSGQAAQTPRKLAAHKVQAAPLMPRGSLKPALIARDGMSAFDHIRRKAIFDKMVGGAKAPEPRSFCPALLRESNN